MPDHLHTLRRLLVCNAPAFPTQIARIRELAAMTGGAGIRWAEEEVKKPMTCNQAYAVIRKLGLRIVTP